MSHANPTAELHPRRVLALLVALWAVLFLAGCVTPPILDDADGTHANAARQMLLSHDWVTLRVNNVRYLEKAPLPYWIVALCFRLFGLNAFAAHLPQALAVLALALLGFRWAGRHYGARAGLYTGLFTLTSAGVFLFTRVLIPDVLLALLLAAALYTFLRSLHPHEAQTLRSRTEAAQAPLDQPQSLYPYALWTALALAVLTKGLVALVFFFGTAALYLALTGDYAHWRRLRPLSGLLLFTAIAAPWHILAGLRNTQGMNGHGFFWFYFVNEHVLRFLGRRIPKDYNKLPGSLYWSLHLIWLFPWSLFAGALIQDAFRSLKRFLRTSPLQSDQIVLWHPFAVVFVGMGLQTLAHIPYLYTVCAAILLFIVVTLRRRQSAAATGAPMLRIHTSAQRTTLLLALFSGLVLVFFSLSTNQEYYTLPAYLPILILLAATLAHTEQPLLPLTLAHAALTTLGALIAAALAYGLWTSRGIRAPSDIGALLAHRGVGDYTLSMSSLFDLTGPSFAALRLPAALALAAFAIGPGIAWLLRSRRRHLAATTAIALTSAVFLIAAHIALARFAPMLSSEDMARTILALEHTGKIAPDTEVLLFGDQAYGSSIGFYLNRPLSQPVCLVDGRSSSMLFGSYFPDADAQHLFLTPAELLDQWGHGPRKILFIPIERRAEAERLLAPSHPTLLQETSGKLLLTDRPLDSRHP
ncbi:MAG: glycosyltransferase family 39 protein [Acidobacteriota bacterium]|nr:glycosyltransferase family 39 protein [Acidobacteriota bacterium]